MQSTLHRRRLCVLSVLHILSTLLLSAVVRSWPPPTTTSGRNLFPRRQQISFLRMSCSSSHGREEDDGGGEIIMLSGYPFYVNGPDPKAIEQVAEKAKKILQEACGEQLKSANRMGSSAIDGMAGTPVCDIVAQLSPWPMTDVAKARMERAGYEFKGNAPHAPQDEWFFGGEGEPGHLGRVVLHTVPEGSDFVREMKAFIEYVKTRPDVFQRYNDVKVEGAALMSKSAGEDGRLIGYKMEKSKVCKDILNEAIEWWATTKSDHCEQ